MCLPIFFAWLLLCLGFTKCCKVYFVCAEVFVENLTFGYYVYSSAVYCHDLAFSNVLVQSILFGGGGKLKDAGAVGLTDLDLMRSARPRGI